MTLLSIANLLRYRVCELLLGGPPLQKEGKSLARMRGEVPTCSGNVRGAGAMHEGDGQVAQGSHDLRSRASMQTGAIFAKGHIANVVEPVFDAPVPPR